MSKFNAVVLTLFPEMFPGPLAVSLAGKALEKGLWDIKTLQIRDYATDKHSSVDDTAYGGGAGMVMKPDVIDSAINAARTLQPDARLVYFSPRGARITQPVVEELSHTGVILLCGRYEGVDQRLLDTHAPLELSLGDFVLSGGELAAMALMDACIRLLPGVLGDEESLSEESFGLGADYAGLLEYPHYTKPPVWNGLPVPEVLLSGNHARIKEWRMSQAQDITRARRPDLWDSYLSLGSGNKTKRDG